MSCEALRRWLALRLVPDARIRTARVLRLAAIVPAYGRDTGRRRSSDLFSDDATGEPEGE